MSDNFLTLHQIGQINVAWFSALIALRHHNPRRMFIMLAADGWSPPDWVRSEINAWLAGERRPWPKPLTEKDTKLIAVVEAYHNEPWEGDEKRGDESSGRIERIANKYGVSPKALENFLGFEGGTYCRIRDWRGLERTFEEWGRMLYLGPPPFRSKLPAVHPGV
jgi:hypothetical protein